MNNQSIQALNGLLFVLWGIAMIASLWKLFIKAGQPGWAAIVPIYNVVVLCKVAQRTLWYLLLLMIPVANIYAYCSICNGVSKKFGKGTEFTVGLALLGIVFFPMLAFGNATYSQQIPAESPVQRPSLKSADLETIGKLHELKKQGAITDEEYQAQKAKLVA